MAAGILNKPGMKFGPCEGECEHRDCKQTRSMAATVCPLCGKTIGYSQFFYDDTRSGGLVHAPCLEDKVDAERALAEIGGAK